MISPDIKTDNKNVFLSDGKFGSESFSAASILSASFCANWDKVEQTYLSGLKPEFNRFELIESKISLLPLLTAKAKELFSKFKSNGFKSYLSIILKIF